MILHEIIDDVVTTFLSRLKESRALDIELNRRSQEFSMKQKDLTYYDLWIDDVKEIGNRLKCYISITAIGTPENILAKEIGSDYFINKFRNGFCIESWGIVGHICREIMHNACCIMNCARLY